MNFSHIFPIVSSFGKFIMWIVVCIEIENRSSKQDTGHNGISSTGSKLTPKRACFENACLASCSEGRFTIFKIYPICLLLQQKDPSFGILDLKRYFDNIRRVLYTHGWPRALKLPAVTRAFTCRRAWSRCSPTFCKNLLPLRYSTWILLFRYRPATSHHECWMPDEGWKESQTLSSLVLPESGSNATQYVPHNPLWPSEPQRKCLTFGIFCWTRGVWPSLQTCIPVFSTNFFSRQNKVILQGKN